MAPSTTITTSQSRDSANRPIVLLFMPGVVIVAMRPYTTPTAHGGIMRQKRAEGKGKYRFT